MADRQFKMHNGKKGSALAVRVTPRASHNEIVEILEDGTVRVRLAASPADDESNAALLEFLSEILGVPGNKLDIVAGLAGRDKLISVLDMDVETAHARIVAHIG
jgi:uncharacterized protein YggU (UPF0235/DUF167 family)